MVYFSRKKLGIIKITNYVCNVIIKQQIFTIKKIGVMKTILDLREIRVSERDTECYVGFESFAEAEEFCRSNPEYNIAEFQRRTNVHPDIAWKIWSEDVVEAYEGGKLESSNALYEYKIGVITRY